jgi:hypothetical protein
MLRNGLRALAGQLLYGDAASTDRIARELVARNDQRMWQFLVETIRSDEETRIRVRCLEVLALAAASGEEAAEQVIGALADGPGSSRRTRSAAGKHAPRISDMAVSEGATG